MTIRDDMQHDRHSKLMETMASRLENFRKRYAPGQPFTYEEMRDFNRDLDYLIHTVAITYQQPALDALSNAAALGFSGQMPSVIVDGAKP